MPELQKVIRRGDWRANLCAASVVLGVWAWLCVLQHKETSDAEADSELIARVAPRKQKLHSPTNSESTNVESAADRHSQIVTDREALEFNIEMLRRGYEMLESIPVYTATFFRQERVDQTVKPAQVMQMKIRHEPFSVYLKWLVGNKGREVLFIDGESDNRMLVKLGGWKSRLIPSMKIEPQGRLAMRESRYPVTDIGLLNLCRKLLDHRQLDLERGSAVLCRVRHDAEHDERDCYLFELEYATAEFGEYRKSVQYIDKEWGLPVSIQNFTWPADGCDVTDDESTLLESYSFSDLKLGGQLSDSAFDRKNSQYSFNNRR